MALSAGPQEESQLTPLATFSAAFKAVVVENDSLIRAFFKGHTAEQRGDFAFMIMELTRETEAMKGKASLNELHDAIYEACAPLFAIVANSVLDKSGITAQIADKLLASRNGKIGESVDPSEETEATAAQTRAIMGQV